MVEKGLGGECNSERKNSTLFFQKVAFEVFAHPTLKHLPILFFKTGICVDTSQLLISTCQSLKLAGVAIDAIEKQLVHLFYHSNASGFLLNPLENRKCNTSHRLLYLQSYNLHLRKPERATCSNNRKQGKLMTIM
jgi:hypothetical protein